MRFTSNKCFWINTILSWWMEFKYATSYSGEVMIESIDNCLFITLQTFLLPTRHKRIRLHLQLSIAAQRAQESAWCNIRTFKIYFYIIYRWFAINVTEPTFTRIDSSFISSIAFLRLFLKEIKPWIITSSSSHPVGSSIGIVSSESLLHSKMWPKPEAECTIHPRPSSCPGQCGGNRGSLAQAQRHKSNTRNWEIKLGL